MAFISYDSLLYKIYKSIITPLGECNWSWLKEKITGRRYYNLTDVDLDYLRQALSLNYFIIATRRKTVLSTYLIGLATFFKTGKFGHYDHVLLNLEDDAPKADAYYQLYEATAKGAHISTFMDVFNCDSVVLMRPKNITVVEWHEVVEGAKKDLGKQYDDLFNLNDSTRVSCVEMVRDSLKCVDGYDAKFVSFEAAIKKVGNLTPQMYYDSDDFEKVWEIRR
jgi:hypothetical protein